MPQPLPAIEAGPAGGELVVCLHGFPQGKETWRGVLDRLGAAGFHAVAFDQRGYREGPGAPPPPGPAYRLPALAADVLDVADAAGAERFHVVGHDWGGAVAWKLAADHADRVASVTVVATPHPRAFVRSLAGTQALRSLYIAAFQVPVLPERALRAGGGAVLGRMLRRSGLDAHHADRYTRQMAAPGALEGALAWYRSNGPGTVSDVGPSRVPTVYVWPSADVALGRAAAERTGDHVEAPYRFVVLDGCPHWVPELRPDELAALVAEHAAAHPAAASAVSRR